MIDTLFNIFLGLMGAGALVGFIYFSLWAVLHKLLPPKLDPILFREPWFQKSELVNYQFFPLSLIRSLRPSCKCDHDHTLQNSYIRRSNRNSDCYPLFFHNILCLIFPLISGGITVTLKLFMVSVH